MANDKNQSFSNVNISHITGKEGVQVEYPLFSAGFFGRAVGAQVACRLCLGTSSEVIGRVGPPGGCALPPVPSG